MNILHIERSNLVSKIIKRIITESGNFVHNAADSEKAYEILGKGNIDFIITGLELDDIDGEEFVKKLHESEYRNIPVLILTGNDDIESKEKLFNFGVVDYINKKYISDENFKRYFDVFLREDRLLRDLRGLDIAVLDDSKVCLNIVKKIMDFNSITKVDYFSEPERLIESKKSYDFYIIDLVMPRMSGEEVVVNIRERNKDSIIMVVTSVDNEKVINNIIVSGADDFISKPFKATTLLSRMKANVRLYLKVRTLKEGIKD